MRRSLLLLVLVLLGAAVLAPIIILAEPAPLPGDFPLTLEGHQFSVPVIYSLCASGALGLLYWFVRR